MPVEANLVVDSTARSKELWRLTLAAPRLKLETHVDGNRARRGRRRRLAARALARAQLRLSLPALRQRVRDLGAAGLHQPAWTVVRRRLEALTLSALPSLDAGASNRKGRDGERSVKGKSDGEDRGGNADVSYGGCERSLVGPFEAWSGGSVRTRRAQTSSSKRLDILFTPC